MTNQQLISQFNDYVALWLDDEHNGKFELDGVEFELEYEDDKYRVLCEGVEVAYNDNARDFRQIGVWLLNNGDFFG
jgi:hypothetical protein